MKYFAFWKDGAVGKSGKRAALPKEEGMLRNMQWREIIVHTTTDGREDLLSGADDAAWARRERKS